MLRSMIVYPHKRDCGALKQVRLGNWVTPWAYVTEKELSGSSKGLRKNGITRWRTVICNSTDCPGVIAFNEKDLLLQLPES